MSEALLEYGIFGAFSELCLMRGEDAALIFGKEHIALAKEKDGDGDEDEEEEEEEDTISYLQLQFAATALAAVLYHRLGVRRGDRVLICCGGIQNTGAEITSLLACLRLQCLFVPLSDLVSLQEVVADSQPTAGIVVGNSDEDEVVSKFAHAGLFRVVLVHSTGELVLEEASASDIREDLPPILLPPPPAAAAAAAAAAATEEKEALVVVVEEEEEEEEESNDALYLLYTSGSTGVPKGVLGKHSALVNRLCWQFDQFPFEFGEVCCRRTPLHFVDAMAEIFAPLLSGIPIFVPPMSEYMQGGIGAIAASAQAQGVSRITLLPSQLSQALTTNCAVMEAWKDLRVVVVSGEACPSTLVTRFATHMPHATLVNLFGSTEIAGDVAFAVLYSTSYPCCQTYKWPQTSTESDVEDKCDWLVPIGHAITNNSLLVVTEVSGDIQNEEKKNLVFNVNSDGIEGELLVSGHHLAAGYFQRQEETEVRFISPVLRGWIGDREQEREIYFRTGDLAVRCATSGALYWIGRRDLQCKVRGVRIELEGAERAVCKALSSTPFGDESKIAMIAVDLEQQGGAVESTIQLILFVETNAVKEIRELLSSSPSFSPLFMPTLILPVDKVPRNATGKVNRRQLRDAFEIIVVENRQAQSSKRAPQSSSALIGNIEERLFIITKQVLPLMDVLPRCHFTDEDTFFSLGGDSMRSIEFLWRIKQEFPFAILAMRDLHSLSIPQLVTKILQLEALVATTSERERKVPRLHEDVTQGDKQPLSPLLIHNGKTILVGRGGFLSTFPSHAGDPLLLSSELSQLLIPISTSTSSSSSSSSAASSSSSFADPTFDSSLPMMMTERWNVQMERCVDASPLLVATSLSLDNPLMSAHIYLGAHSGQFSKINAATGISVWSLQLGGHIEGAATCTRDGAMIFVASFKSIDIHGVGAAADAASGIEGANVGSVWAIRSEGHIAWTRNLPCEVKGAPTVDEERSLLFVGCYDACVHIFGIADGIETNVLECNGSVFASPLLLPCGSVIAAATSGIVSCFSGLGFATSWTYTVDAPIFSSLIYTAEMVLFGAVDGTLRCISSDSGREIWVAPWATRPVFSTPCFSHQQTRVLYGSHDGFLRSVSLLDGSLLWDCDMGAVVFAAPTVFFDYSSSSKAVVATTAGEVLIVDIREKEKEKGSAKISKEEEESVENQQWRIVSRIKLAAEIYSSPVVCSLESGFIFIGARDDRLHCLSLR